jgi:hypothetical protein
LSFMRILPLLSTFADLASAFTAVPPVTLRSASLSLALILELVESDVSVGRSVASGLNERTNCRYWIPCLFWIFWVSRS